MLQNPELIISGQSWPITSRAVAAARNIPATISTILTNGYYTPGDGGGALYKRVGAEPSHAGKFQSLDGAWFEIVDTGELTVTQFGVRDNTDDTTNMQGALDWLGAGKTLNVNVKILKISAASLVIPDASEWTIKSNGSVQGLQLTDNTPFWEFRPSASRFGFFFFEGTRFEANWQNNQTTANTNSIVFAVNPTGSIADGCHHFTMGTIVNENGYRGLAFHPSAAGKTCPMWGYQIERLESQTNATGAMFDLNSPVAAGAPAGQISSYYAKCTNVGENSLVVTAQNSVLFGTVEFNDCNRRVMEITSAFEIVFQTLRFEIGTLANTEDLASIAGETNAVIQSLILQSIVVGGTAESYGITSFGDANVSIGSITVNNCSGSSTGKFYALRPQSGGSFFVSPQIRMQTTSNLVLLYSNTNAASIYFVDNTDYGPFNFNTVSGAAFGAMVLCENGATQYYDAIVTKPGYVTQLNVYLSAAITAGTLTAYVSINGTDIGAGAFNLPITSGQSGNKYIAFAWEPSAINATHRVAVGDRIRVKLSASGVTGGGNGLATVSVANSR